MGAYFAYSITKENEKGEKEIFFIDSDLKEKIVKDLPWNGLKFLESFYHNNIDTKILYKILKHYKKIILNTQCDYDKKDSFKYQNEFHTSDDYELNSNLIKEIEKLLLTYKGKINYSENVEVGYIVCPKKKQYIDLNYFNKMNKKYKDNWLISPLALLTRSNTINQGGGDFDFEIYLKKIFCTKFKENDIFDINLVSNWKDEEILYIEDLSKINNKEFKDISLYITLILED